MADRAGREPVTVAIVLAAGEGSRFAGPHHKLAAVVDGHSLAEHAIGTALTADIGPVIVVTGAAGIAALHLDDRLAAQVTVVHNPRWADGQSTSLRAGLVAADDRFAAEAAVIGLADQPGVVPEAWRRVAAATAPIAIATYAGERRNPVRLTRAVWDLMPTGGDAGARTVARLRPDLVREIPCPGSADDIDTVEDLSRWQK